MAHINRQALGAAKSLALNLLSTVRGAGPCVFVTCSRSSRNTRRPSWRWRHPSCRRTTSSMVGDVPSMSLAAHVLRRRGTRRVGLLAAAHSPCSPATATHPRTDTVCRLHLCIALNCSPDYQAGYAQQYAGYAAPAVPVQPPPAAVQQPLQQAPPSVAHASVLPPGFEPPPPPPAPPANSYPPATSQPPSIGRPAPRIAWRDLCACRCRQEDAGRGRRRRAGRQARQDGHRFLLIDWA